MKPGEILVYRAQLPSTWFDVKSNLIIVEQKDIVIVIAAITIPTGLGLINSYTMLYAKGGIIKTYLEPKNIRAIFNGTRSR